MKIEREVEGVERKAGARDAKQQRRRAALIASGLGKVKSDYKSSLGYGIYVQRR